MEAFALLGLAALSLPLIPKARRISLPEEEDDSQEAGTAALLASVNKKKGSIDLSEKQIEEDNGEPLQPEAFFGRMKQRKLVVGFASICILGLHSVILGQNVVSVVRKSEGLPNYGLLLASNLSWLVYWSIIISVILLAIPTRSRHWGLTIHLSIFTLLPLLAYLTPIAVPRSVVLLPGHAADESRVELSILAALCLVAFIGCVTMPRSPPTHYEAAKPAGVNADAADAYSGWSNVSPLARASILSRMMFSWATPLIRATSSKPQLDASDIPFLPATFRAATQMHRFSLRPAKRRLIPHLLYVNRRVIIIQSCLAATNSALYYLPAFFLLLLVRFLEGDRESQVLSVGVFYCVGLLSSFIFEAVIAGQLWFYSSTSLACQIRMQLNSALFAKTLRRKDLSGVSSATETPSSSPGSPQPDKAPSPSLNKNKVHNDHQVHDPVVNDTSEETVATPASFNSRSQVLNLFSVDVDRVAEFSSWSFSVVDAPLELIIGSIFLYRLLGTAALWGIAVTVLFLPANHYLSKAFASTQDKLMAARDRRVSLMNEIMASIRMLKFMAWEAPFEKRIMDARDEELKQQRNNYILEVFFEFVYAFSPVACICVAFFVYTYVQGHRLTPSVAFASIAVFNELRFAINIIPDVLINALQSYVSLKRIDVYLQSPEVTSRAEETNGNIVAMRSATVSWPTLNSGTESEPSTTPNASRNFMLRDISIDFASKGLNLVCGPLGSGKTLLLLALLGEADLVAGQIICPQSKVDAVEPFETEQNANLTDKNWIRDTVCAYVPQSAWLQNATIRENIIFGLRLNEKRYQDVLYACSLTVDLAVLEDGDETEIGEKGVNLSGGQQARISLARAVYSRAGVLLLDDVLSAVDTHTADHIYKNCLKGNLLKGRTVILVSHHAQLLAPGADQIVLLGNGAVLVSGTYKEFAASDYATTYLGVEDEEPEIKAKAVNKVLHRLKQNGRQGSDASSDSSDASSDESSDDEDENEKRAAKKLIEDEARAVGTVKTEVWQAYVKANGPLLFWLAFVLVFVGQKAVDIGETAWLGKWSAADLVDGKSPELFYYLGIFALISLVNVVVETAQSIVLYNGSLRASHRLHQGLLHSVLRAPLRFFDTIALGRLINRFAKDLEGIDSQLPDNLGKTINYSLGVLATVVSITWVAPPFLPGFCVISIGYLYYARLYSHAARELRRLDSVSKSPIFSLYGETISGAAVIRAFGGSSRALAILLQKIDTNIAFFFYLWSVNRWLSMRFALLSGATVGLTGFVLLATRDKISASVAGFALTFALDITNEVTFLVRRYTALELSLVAVERVKEYSEEIEQEAPAIIEPRPAPTWPAKGAIMVDKLSIRYAEDLPDVLHEVSFSVQAGEKIGVVGSTGSGKSTLALSFFRFVEAHAGRIMIDGIDISQIGLYDLRSRLTIIPQQPTILSGNLRQALDTFSEHSDEDLFSALKRVHLLPEHEPTNLEEGENANIFYNLDTEISEQGTNLSAGQRQLVCMARALLARSKIVLMDEATSNVDYATDEALTKAIRQEFDSATLMVIAHRLRTIITFNKVLVLDQGRVAEFDKPSVLLNDIDSKFYQLCASAGRREFKILKKLADGETVRASKLAANRPKKVGRTFSKMSRGTDSVPQTPAV